VSDTTSSEADVEQAEVLLRNRLRGRVWELRVVVLEGGVVLRGYAFSYHAKQLAQHAAMRVFAVPVRLNEIQVRPLEWPESGEPGP